MIKTHPILEDGTPFPTLYWLTCRTLSSAIGRLEGGGLMAEVNSRIGQESDFHSALARSTEKYIRMRDSLYLLESRSHPGGGPDRVKCLHAHVAHELVESDNPVGRLCLERLGWSDPAEPCV